MKKFDWVDFLKKLAVIAIPIALQNLLTTTGSMIDTIMIAPLGQDYVGAVGLCAQYSTLMFSSYWGFVGGGMLFFAQFWGAKDDDGIDRAYGITLTCMMFVAFLFASLAIFMPGKIMSVYTDKTELGTIGISYLKLVGFSYIFSVLSMAVSALLRSTERVKIPLFASIVSVFTNIFLNWVFIYGHLGFEPMGVRGAALATLCASFVNAVTLFVLAGCAKYPYLFHIKKFFCWSGGWLKSYFAKCFPIICNELLIGVGNLVINVVLGHQSQDAIAAVAVFRTLEGLVIGFFAGFSNAASVLVGKCVGEGALETAYERAKRLIYCCQAVIFLLGAALISLNYPILSAMGLSGEAYRIGRGLLIIYCAVAVIRMGNWIQNDTYRSAGDSSFGTILEIVFMYVCVLPCLLVSNYVLKSPFFIVFVCCYIDEPIRYILMQVHLYSGKWIKPVTPQGKLALEEFRRKRSGN